MANIFGRQLILPVKNNTAGALVLGDVVIVDTSADTAVTTTTSAGSTLPVGVVQETIAAGATGRVLFGGYTSLVNVAASVTRGQYGATHTVAKQAAGTSVRGAGTFVEWLTGRTTPAGFVFPTDLLGSSLTNPMTTAGDIIVGGASGAPARLADVAVGQVLRSGGVGVAPAWGPIVKLGTPIVRTAGSHTCNSTTWVELAAATGGPGGGGYDFDFTGVVAGDIAEVTMSVGWGSEATNGCLTVATIVSAAIVNYFIGAPTSTSGDGILGLYGPSGTFVGQTATAFYVLQSGDLSAGALKLRPLYRTTSANNKTLYGTTGDTPQFMAKIFRP